jgi:hypothetical protein
MALAPALALDGGCFTLSGWSPSLWWLRGSVGYEGQRITQRVTLEDLAIPPGPVLLCTVGTTHCGPGLLLQSGTGELPGS